MQHAGVTPTADKAKHVTCYLGFVVCQPGFSEEFLQLGAKNLVKTATSLPHVCDKEHCREGGRCLLVPPWGSWPALAGPEGVQPSGQ